MRHASATWCALLAGTVCAAAVGPAAAQQHYPLKVTVTDEIVDAAIGRGVQFIWTRQNAEGHWETHSDADWAKLPRDPNSPTAESLNRGGLTALALLGLFHAGQDPRQERFTKALNWLSAQDGPGTYMRGLRAALWAALVGQYDRELDGRIRKLLSADVNLLVNGVWPHGTYGYFPRPPDMLPPRPEALQPVGDFSNTQYGILGVWAGSERGLEVPVKYWQVIQHGYVWGQQRDGGWRYPVTPEHKTQAAAYPGSRDGLTLGGVASLFVVWDKFYAAGPCDRPVDPELVAAIARAVEWLGKHFDRFQSEPPRFIEPYVLYSLERAGVSGGLKRFGTFDWSLEGTKLALLAQQADGSWPTGWHYPVAGTSWTLLFLVYGRAPVLVNKLAHGGAEEWNARPRDLANLTRWLGAAYERKFNWQIVTFEATADFHDAPILYITGKRPLKLTDPQKAALKGYIERGGTVLASPAGRPAEFNRAFQALMLELFPGREFVPVGRDDPLYTAAHKIAPPPQLLGLSNGYRWLVLLSTSDLGCAWQQARIPQDRASFQLAANLYMCVSDRGQLKGRGHSYWLTDAGNRPARTIPVGRLIWGSPAQSDPEPAAWAAQDIRIRNSNPVGLNTLRTDLSEPLDPAAVPLLHVTGVTAITLTDQAKANLKQYVQGGGVLLADAAGGSELFARSFRELMAEQFGADALVPAPAGLPFVAEAGEDGKVWFRHRFGLPRSQRPFDVHVVMTHPDRSGVIFLGYDLSAAMVGYSSHAPVGLTPETANRFVLSLLNWLIRSARPAASAPAP